MSQTGEKDSWGSSSFCSDVNIARQFILEPRLTLVKQLAELVNATQIYTIGKALSTIFQYHECSEILLMWAIDFEVEHSTEYTTVLRQDSVSNQILAQIFHFVGMEYRRNILRADIIKLLRSSPKAKTPKKIRAIAVRLINRLCSTVDTCPYQIKKACRLLHERISQKFANQDHTLGIIVSFFMLRYICPAIVSPVHLGVIDVTPPDCRPLVPLAKLLQQVANSVLNGDTQEPELSNKLCQVIKSFLANDAKTPRNTLHIISEENEEEAVKEIQTFIRRTVEKQHSRRVSLPASRACGAMKVADNFQYDCTRVEAGVARIFCLMKYDETKSEWSFGGAIRQRYLRLPSGAFGEDFYQTLRRCLNLRKSDSRKLANLILYYTFEHVGRIEARFLAKRPYEQEERKQTCVIRLASAFAFVANLGWGSVEMLSESKVERKETLFLVCNVSNCYGCSHQEHSKGYPTCAAISGFLKGFCSEILGVKLSSIEVFCKHKGDQCCRFLISANRTIASDVAKYFQRHAVDTDPSLSPERRSLDHHQQYLCYELTSSSSTRRSFFKSLSRSIITRKEPAEPNNFDVIAKFEDISLHSKELGRSWKKIQERDRIGAGGFLANSIKHTTLPGATQKQSEHTYEAEFGLVNAEALVEGIRLCVNTHFPVRKMSKKRTLAVSNLLYNFGECFGYACTREFRDSSKQDLAETDSKDKSPREEAGDDIKEKGKEKEKENENGDEEAPMSDVMALAALKHQFRASGMGEVETDPGSIMPSETSQFFLLLDVTNSVELKPPDVILAQSTTRCCCFVTAGFCAGLMSAALHRKLTAVELQCRSSGASGCRFLLAAPQMILPYSKFYYTINPKPTPQPSTFKWLESHLTCTGKNNPLLAFNRKKKQKV